MEPLHAKISSRTQDLSTAGGFLAIGLWSLAVAFARSLSEQLGAVTALAAVYAVSGSLAFARDIFWHRRWGQIRQLSRLYIIGCGALFIGYMLVLFLAVGMATDRQQVLEVGLLNYLWPTLTLVFSLLFLNKRAGPFFFPGTLLALTGIFLVMTHKGSVSWGSFYGNLADNPPAYLLGGGAAILWALYSTLTNRWARGQAQGAVAVFMPGTAIVMLVVCLWVDEPRAWNVRAVAEVGLLGVATYLGYALWDTAMRQGNVILVASAAYLTPFFSTLVACLYLSVRPGPELWAGCGLLIAGSLLSWYSITDGVSR